MNRSEKLETDASLPTPQHVSPSQKGTDMPPKPSWVELTCNHCGITYSLPPAKAKRSRYCTAKCRDTARGLRNRGANNNRYSSAEVQCSHCGKALLRPEWRRKRNAHHFCDHACKAAFQAGRPNLKGRRQVELRCEHCGKTYSKPQSQAVGSRFCSAACRNTATGLAQRGTANYMFNSKLVPCATCGNMLSRPLRRILVQQNHFCDQDCKAEWQREHLRGEANPVYSREPRQCMQCGTEITVNRYKAKHGKWHFCGQACYAKWRSANLVGKASPSWKGGYKKYYGPNWTAQRRKARKRDGYKCQHCGITEKQLGRELDVHHIKPFREFGIENYRAANHLTNLISLCNACHRLAETQKIAFQPKLL